MKLNPFLAFLKSNGYLLKGRLHFPKNRIGEAITMADGQRYVVFRQAFVDEDAENYANSFAMRFSRRQSAPGTFTCKVTPGGEE